MKIFLAVGNTDIEEMLKQGDYEVVDTEDSLIALYDLLEYIEIEGLVINRLLDTDGSKLIKIAKRAADKGIKVVTLVEGFEDYEERKLITSLVNNGLTAFIKFCDLTTGLLTDTLNNYPNEFDFGLFSKTRIEYRDKIKSVFKEVFVVYSPLGQGASTHSSHLALALAEAKNCRVCLADFNPLTPRIKEIYDMNYDFTLGDAIDDVVKGILTPERLEEITKQSKYHKNLDILFGLYDINDYYATKLEQYEEVIEKLKFSYDYVIIDTHSWYDVLSTDAALMKADKVIVPVRGNKFSLDEMHRYLEMFDRYQDFDTRKFGIVINQYSGRDLTYMEIGAKCKYPILGYISKNHQYQEGNAFKNKRLMNEYVDILNALEIDAKKQNLFFESVTGMLKRNKPG